MLKAYGHFTAAAIRYRCLHICRLLLHAVNVKVRTLMLIATVLDPTVSCDVVHAPIIVVI